MNPIQYLNYTNNIRYCLFEGEGGIPGGVLRGGGSAVRFHDCTNNAAMTQMRDLKDMVSTSGYLTTGYLTIILSCKAIYL